MSHYFLSDIIKGLDLKIDVARTWLPLLQEATAERNPANRLILKVGSTSIAALGVAAVEQAAETGQLRQGTSQGLRLRGFGIYQSALTQIIYEKAQLKILEMLAEQKPELAAWVENVVNEIRSKTQAIWFSVADATIQLLTDIQAQRLRRELFREGKKGRLQVFNGQGAKPGLHFRGYIDVGVLTDAQNALPISKQDDTEELRKNIRQQVKDYLARGYYPSWAGTQSEEVDKHCKRLYRKIPDWQRLRKSKGPMKAA